MKKFLIMAATLLVAVSCGAKKESKTLVLYYSQGGTTKVVAEAIQQALGADIEEILPVDPYDPDFNATISRGQKEMNEGKFPELEPIKANVKDYDVIFVGYPVWFGTYANPIETLLTTVDFSGKEVVPFCTFGSGGLDTSSKAIAAKLPNATVLPGYGVRAARAAAIPAEVESFLKAGGFLAGESDWGYNSLTHLAIHKWLYDRLNRSDFRKRSFIDPDRETYPASYYEWGDQAGFLKDYPFAKLPNYFSLKIRCKGGDWQTYSVGGAVDWPIMRVEEMYLIEAEAVGMSQGEAKGIEKLEAFMQTYRDPQYSYAQAASTFDQGFVKNFQEEVLFQKRVEFLEEGVGFFDAKRIRPGMKTWYKGSNVIHDRAKYDIEEVSPYWNFVIPTSEIENNDYIVKEDDVVTEIEGVKTTRNNPDPTDKVKTITTKF